MHLALALGSLAVSVGALAFVIITGRRTARLNAKTAATWKQVEELNKDTAAKWARVAELNAQARADRAITDETRWNTRGRA